MNIISLCLALKDTRERESTTLVPKRRECCCSLPLESLVIVVQFTDLFRMDPVDPIPVVALLPLQCEANCTRVLDFVFLGIRLQLVWQKALEEAPVVHGVANGNDGSSLQLFLEAELHKVLHSFEAFLF